MSYFTKRSKRIVAGTLAGALALSVSPILGLTGIASAADALPPIAEPIGAGNFCEGAPTTEPFTDVTATDPSLDEIICLVATGLTKGTTPTTYSPNASITRRQMALFIKRLADLANKLDTGTQIAPLPADDGTTAPFTDIEGESAEAKAAISQLNTAGIVQGTTATSYSPGANVSRRQMAAFINRLEQFLTGAAFTTTGDFFDDDEGDSGEANLNAVASVGIFQGDGAGNVFPGADLTRRQMANVLLRHAQVMMDQGDIGRAFTATPQAFTVGDGTKGSDLGATGARTCVVSGITAGSTVDAALFPSEDVRIAANGTVTFTDAGGDSLADNEGNTGAVIANVNGTPTGGVGEVNNIVSPTGTISVTLVGVVADDVTLVIWSDQAGFTADTLDLTVAANTNPKTPREVFGVGCRTLFADEAAGGFFAEFVESTDKGTNLFTGGGSNFFYDENDTFQIGGVPQPAGAAGLTAFEARLSPGDFVIGTYAPDPAGVSTFNLDDLAPLVPANSDTTGSSGTTVVLNYDESDTPTVDTYNIYRIVRPAAAVVCPDFNTAGATGRGAYPATPTATQPDPTPSADGNTVRTFTDTGLTANTTYCYAVTAVDEGDESATATQEVITTAAVGSAPTITDVRATDLGTVGILDAGDVHQFIFSEVMNTSVDAANEVYRVVDADGTVGEVTCGVTATCLLQGAGTFNGTAYPAGQVLRVTVTTTPPVIVGFAGTTPGLQYPVTITNVSAGWDDAGGAQLDLAGSPDKVINVDTITGP